MKGNWCSGADSYKCIFWSSLLCNGI